MKILFVENRYKTGFYELIAKELMEDGHNIFWIVQNHTFKPKLGSTIFLPYPDKKFKGKKEYTSDVKKIVESNRGMNYFEVKEDDFIFYYKQEIQRSIGEIMPDIVFGEPTLFHELLIINECRKRGILYLNATSCRYPSGRISFYKYDTLETFGGSSEEISDAKAWELIQQIVSGKVVPDYMKKTATPAVSSKDKLLDRLRISTAYFTGERYNTPSPFVKLKLEKNKRKMIEQWEEIAEPAVKDDRQFKVLYPMQMQPEANIDVWGYPNNNQEKVIEWILEQLPSDAVLYIKPNPKSKYELTLELIEMVNKERDRLVVLKHATKMTDVFPKIDFVITVTGTISYECIWGDKPFQMLGKAMQTKYCRGNDYTLMEALQLAKKGKLKTPDEDKISFMKELVRTSYQAKVTDTLNGKNILSDTANVTGIVDAFKHIIEMFSTSHPKVQKVPA